MRHLVILLLVAGCGGDGQDQLGESLDVRVASPVAFNRLVVMTTGPFPFASQQCAALGTTVTTCNYQHNESMIGACPRSLSLKAQIDDTVVATGDLPNITYVLTDNDQLRESYALVDITLTAE